VGDFGGEENIRVRLFNLSAGIVIFRFQYGTLGFILLEKIDLVKAFD